jgi:hypothetical protein
VNDIIKEHAHLIADAGGFRVLIPDLYKGKVGLDAEEASHVSAAAVLCTAARLVRSRCIVFLVVDLYKSKVVLDAQEASHVSAASVSIVETASLGGSCYIACSIVRLFS